VILFLEYRAQLVEFLEHERAALAVLRRPWLEAHDSGRQVDLMSLQRQDLATRAPASQIGERHDGLQRGRQVTTDRFELLMFEEAPTDVVLAEERDVQPLEKLPGVNRQAEHALQSRELPIDGGCRRVRVQAGGDVGVDVGRHDVRHPADARRVLTGLE